MTQQRTIRRTISCDDFKVGYESLNSCISDQKDDNNLSQDPGSTLSTASSTSPLASTDTSPETTEKEENSVADSDENNSTEDEPLLTDYREILIWLNQCEEEFSKMSKNNNFDLDWLNQKTSTVEKYRDWFAHNFEHFNQEDQLNSFLVSLQVSLFSARLQNINDPFLVENIGSIIIKIENNLKLHPKIKCPQFELSLNLMHCYNVIIFFNNLCKSESYTLTLKNLETIISEFNQYRQRLPQNLGQFAPITHAEAEMKKQYLSLTQEQQQREKLSKKIERRDSLQPQKQASGEEEKLSSLAKQPTKSSWSKQGFFKEMSEMMRQIEYGRFEVERCLQARRGVVPKV